MKIGVLKEIKNNENRVALTPMGAFMLTELGHDVFVETNAGLGSGFTNMEYIDAGARILETAKEVWEGVELALKVKEPQPSGINTSVLT